MEEAAAPAGDVSAKAGSCVVPLPEGFEALCAGKEGGERLGCEISLSLRFR